MKIVGVAACTVGIAHTYIAQEKLENAAKKQDTRCISKRKERLVSKMN